MKNLELELFTPFDKPTYSTTSEMISFLYNHSNEVVRRNKEDIRKSIEYALKERASLGGYIVVIRDECKLVGVSILNKTGLEGIMPDYILSHLAIDNKFGKGSSWEQILLKKTLELCNGNVAFLVEANNPMVDACIEQGFEYKRLELVFSKASGGRASESKLIPQAT